MKPLYRSLRLFRKGISKDEDKVTNERIVLANIIYISVAVVTAIGYVLDYEVFLQPLSSIVFDQYSSLILMIIAICSYLLNSNGRFYESKVLFTISWLLLSFYLNPLIQGTSSDYYFHYDTAIIFISVVIQILFSTKREPITYSFFTIFTFGTIIFHQHYLLLFNNDSVVADIIANDRYIRLIPVYYWFLLNLITAYVITVYERSHGEAIEKNEAFQNLNKNLEKEVEARTEKIRQHQEELEIASAELKQSQQRYYDFVHNSHEGVVRFEMTTPLDTRMDIKEQVAFLLENQFIAECNDSFAKMYGFNDSEEITGKKLHEIWEESPERDALLLEYIERGYRFENFETLEQTQSGERKWFLNFGKSYIVDHYLYMLWVTQVDITQRVRTTEEKEALLKDLEEYAFITSHEIRRPLSTLMQIAHVITEGGNEDELPKMIKYLKTSAEELDTLIRKMADTLSRTSYYDTKHEE